MTRIGSSFALGAFYLLTLAGCGGEEAGDPGGISAEITCTTQDSLLATVYMTDGESAAASEWCDCNTEACSITFDGLGYGAYVLGVSRPDSLYSASGGTEGFTQTLGYYGQGGLTETADTIRLTEAQPSTSVQLSIGNRPTLD